MDSVCLINKHQMRLKNNYKKVENVENQSILKTTSAKLKEISFKKNFENI